MRRILFTMAACALAVPALAADKKVEEAVARAEQQLAKGQTDQAQKTMDRMAQQNSTSAEAQAAYARFQLRMGNTDSAATAAAEAVKLAASATPDVKAGALVALAETDLQRGSGKDAVAHAQEAVAAAGSPATLSVLARAQARVGDAAAVATAQKAVAVGATSAAAHESLGHALLAMQRGDEAAAAFRKALELEPKRASARTGLAGALLQTGKSADAVTEARKATEDDPKSGEAFAVLGTAILAAAPKKEAGWGDAIAQAQQGAFLSPRNAVVQVAVGKLFEAGGNLDQAANAYRKALEADPGYAPAQLSLLQIESRKGDLDKAIARAREIAAQQPQNMEVQLTLGTLLARKGEWTDAVEPLKKAADALSGNAEAQALAGTAYQYVGESDDALAYYKKAVALAPNDIEYRTTYGLLLGLNKQHKEGIAELQKVTATPGYKDAAGWVNLGWLYRDSDQPGQSVAAYQKALQIDPKNSQAALGLAWAALFGDKYDEAITAFTRAMELDKANTVVALNGIGWAYYFKKDMAQAESYFQKASAAGRGDTRLATAIKNYRERGEAALRQQQEEIKAAERREREGGDVDSLGAQLMSGGARATSAAVKLGGMGAPAVQYLLYAAVNARSWGVRQAAIRSLGNIGPAARSACAQLNAIARANPYEKTVMTKEEQQDWVNYEDLRRAARTAASRIGC